MNSAASGDMYIPPAFDLYEFEDGRPSAAEPARRWFSNWGALAGNPADEVVLAWSPGAGVVATVGTSDRSHERTWLRSDRAVQALGGDLPAPAAMRRRAHAGEMAVAEPVTITADLTGH